MCAFELFHIQKGYHYWNPTTRKYVLCADMAFAENKPYFLHPLTKHPILCHCLQQLAMMLSMYRSAIRMIPHQKTPDIQPIATFFQHHPKPATQIPSISPQSTSSTEDPDSDVPISLIKGKWSYTTKHLISNVISFSHLSTTYLALPLPCTLRQFLLLDIMRLYQILNEREL